jgi:CheY-like chemotaxis protein
MSPVTVTIPATSDALRVLVAAGDPYSLDHTAQALEQNGFIVRRAADGAGALEK